MTARADGNAKIRLEIPTEVLRAKEDSANSPESETVSTPVIGSSFTCPKEPESTLVMIVQYSELQIRPAAL